ncbi:MAG: MBL fold metallo-hydrolase [Pseudomonadota bacterium]
MAIPFVLDPDSRPGIVYRPRHVLRRVVAANPGPFTYTGTGSYIVGEGIVAIIDPGPCLPDHVAALTAAIKGEKLSHILITHAHRDHAPAARLLKEATGAPILGCARPAQTDETPSALEEAVDQDYRPDRVLRDGEAIEGPGWTLGAMATPGHTANHLCYHWREENALFSGDHIMGWSTSVIAPPDGDMAAYMASLERVARLAPASLIPTHGQPVMAPQAFIAALIAHRQAREAAIMDCVESGVGTIPDIVARLYAGVPKTLHPAAAQSVLAHLIKLAGEGRVAAEPAPRLDAHFTSA